MDKKLITRLLIGFFLALALVCTSLSLAFSLQWIQFSHADRVAGPVVVLLASCFGVLCLFLMIGVGIYVYRDAKSRGMEPLLWTLVAIFVPYLLGLVIYLVVRQTGQVRCPVCGTSTTQSASFCSSCGKPMVRPCPKCQTPLARGARFCHSCGAEAAALEPGSTPAG